MASASPDQVPQTYTIYLRTIDPWRTSHLWYTSSNMILRKLWQWSDRLDIWIQETFKYDAKKKALELKMDTIPNKRLKRHIDAALEELMGNERKKHRKEKKKPKKEKRKVTKDGAA